MQSNRQLEVHAWATRHPVSVPMAIHAQQLALNAPRFFEIAQLFRDGRVEHRLPPRPPLNEWLSLYRDHRRVLRGVGDHFRTCFGDGGQSEAAADGWRSLWREIQRDPKAIQEEIRATSETKLRRWVNRGVRWGRRWYREHLRDITADVSGTEPDDPRDFDRILSASPEVHFFFKVVIPCLVVHEATPLQLLREARDERPEAANLQARSIEKLLRLDPSLIHEPRIARWIEGGTGAVRAQRLKLMGLWLQEGPNGRFTLRGVKQSMAGLVSVLSEFMNWRWVNGKLKRSVLTARQILELFDAAARDVGRSWGKWDDDLDAEHLNLESWQKAIQRHRGPWRKLLLPAAVRVDRTRRR